MGKELLAAGHVVDVSEMGSVTSVAGHDAVIIRGPMYMGKIVCDMGKFVRRHYFGLEKLPVAGFIVCLAPVSRDPVTDIEYAKKGTRCIPIPVESGCVDRICRKAGPCKTLVAAEMDH